MTRDYEWPWTADRQSCQAIGRYTYEACQEFLGQMTDSLSPTYGFDVDWLPTEDFFARTCSRGGGNLVQRWKLSAMGLLSFRVQETTLQDVFGLGCPDDPIAWFTRYCVGPS